jgi:hypothetical protein
MRKRQAWVAAAVAAGLSGISPLAFATDNLWTGATSTDWNTATNWSLGRVPVKPSPAPDAFDDAIININLNFPLITADIPVPRDIIVGQGAGANGRVDHTAAPRRRATATGFTSDVTAAAAPITSPTPRQAAARSRLRPGQRVD